MLKQTRAPNQPSNITIQPPPKMPDLSKFMPGRKPPITGGQMPESYIRPMPESYVGQMPASYMRPSSYVSVNSSASRVAQQAGEFEFAPYPVKPQPNFIGANERTETTVPRSDFRLGESPFATPRSMPTSASELPDFASVDTEQSVVSSNISARRIIPRQVSRLEQGSEVGNYRYAIQKAEAIPNRINTPEQEVALNRQIAERQIRRGADRVETERNLDLRPPAQTRPTQFVRGIQQQIEGRGNALEDSRAFRNVRAMVRNRFPNYDNEVGNDVFNRYSESASENSLSSLGNFTESTVSVTPFTSETLPNSMGGGAWRPSDVSMETEQSLSSMATESEAAAGIGEAASGAGELGELGELAVL